MSAADCKFPSFRIAIVDDSEGCRIAVSTLLRKAGYYSVDTYDGAAADMLRLGKTDPDLILLDLHMAPYSGREVLRASQRLMPEESRPPILVMTADAASDAKHEAMRAGAADFVRKPFDPTELLLRINQLLAQRNRMMRCRTYSSSLEKVVEMQTADLDAKAEELRLAQRELSQAREAVMQLERTKNSSILARGVVHDINNCFTLVTAYGDVMLQDTETFPLRSEQRAHLQRLLANCHDSALMLQELQQAANFQEGPAKEPMNLRCLVAEVVELTRPMWEKPQELGASGISVEEDLHDVGLVPGMASEIKRALINVIFNSVEAMPNGGIIKVTLRREHGMVSLRLTDSGMGMTPELLQKCTQPFFSTKGTDGSGLGLAVVKDIADRHQAKLGITSRLGAGTSITLNFPCPEP